jgi:hypothetical protein
VHPVDSYRTVTVTYFLIAYKVYNKLHCTGVLLGLLDATCRVANRSVCCEVLYDTQWWYCSGGRLQCIRVWIRRSWLYWVTVISEDFLPHFGVQIQCFGDGSKETVWCGQYAKHAHTTYGMVTTPTCIMPPLTSRLLITSRNAGQMINGSTGRAYRVE